MFDRGGDIPSIKARCLKETGFPAPRQPEFQAWAMKMNETAEKKIKSPKKRKKAKAA